MAEVSRDLDHLYVEGFALTTDFKSKSRGGTKIREVKDREAHGKGLKRSAEYAFRSFEQERDSAVAIAEELRATGTIIVLEGEGSTCPLKVDSLSSYTRERKGVRKTKWLLLSVRDAHGNEPERATVWVSDAYRQQFLKLFEDYLDDEKNTEAGYPKNRALVANISRIRSAVLEDLWTSESDPPQSGMHWWELWLDGPSDRVGDLKAFLAACRLQARCGEFRLGDRLIVWVQATWQQLQRLPFTSVPLVEIRRPTLIDTIEDLSVDEQTEYVQELASRVTSATDEAPAVCLLDTGVLRTHILLEHSLSSKDHHSIFGGSGNDVCPRGHGTSMAGLALYGNLEPLLVGNERIVLRHRLESVRMIPDRKIGERQPDQRDYGTATAEAVSHPEAVRSKRDRVFCLTLSTDPDKPGQPTLWSASVDALVVGTDIVRSGNEIQLLSTPDPDAARLILVAAGNVARYDDDYRTNSVNSPIQDPAQAWNALTVGAYTEMTEAPSHPQYAGWHTVAAAGDISPHTSTSLYFDKNRWPIKPDICMEGGNTLSDSRGTVEDRNPSLSLRSTGRYTDAALTSANATSAATAQASRLAVMAMERYPSYWPETVRGLLTHSAEWTDMMVQRLDEKNRKGDRQLLLREFGWGVPVEEAVLNSGPGAVTLVTQDSFVPLTGEGYSMRYFRLHSLPWPDDVLESLGASEVRLRITLSYFVEPSASRRGWRSKYAYASHGLRFDLQGPLETQDQFVRRVNKQARKEESGSQSKNKESDRWFLGEKGRSVGSLHQDQWTGTGAELAHCNNVAVYPVGGWWKYNRRKDCRDLPVRYALLLSLYTEEQGVDLYTPIATQLHIPISTEIAGS